MFRTPSRLPENARAELVASLNARLADGIDLYGQIKVAHWNIKGPHFAALHPLLDALAGDASEHNDEIAERAVTLGGRAYGTIRHAAQKSKLPEYPQETTRDLEHVRLVAERIEAWLDGARETRTLAEKHGDADTEDMLTQMVQAWEKHAWFLRASLEG